MQKNPLDIYKQQQQNKILTAKPEELTLMLYDGAVKFCNIAAIAIEKKEYEKAHNNIIKVENIITYLINTLDMQYEVSNEFIKIYNYIQSQLIKANIKKDLETLEKAEYQIKEIRNTWKKVIETNKNNNKK